MKLTSGQRAALAVALVASMLLAAFPMVVGSDAPDLSKVEAGRLEAGDCLTVDLAEEHARALSQRLQSLTEDPEAAPDELPDIPEDPRDVVGADRSVPVICGEGAEELFGALISTGNTALAALEQGLDDIQQAHEENRPVHTLAFLGEPFDGNRTGGLGDWRVGTASEEEGFRRPADTSVTDGYALTDVPGGTYAHGLNTTLVSPAIDLGGVATDPRLANLPAQVERALADNLPTEIQPFRDGALELGVCLSFFLGPRGDRQCLGSGEVVSLGQDVYTTLRTAYLEAAGDLLDTYQEELGAVTLQVQHRFNLAQGLDGVRYEVLTQPPPPQGPAPVGTPIEPRSDSPGKSRGDIAAFNGREGFTGDSDGWVTETFDLTQWTGERVWIVVRARTASAFGIPGFFEDSTLFPDPSDPGYSLGGLFVNGTAHRHNLRVLQVDAGQQEIDGEPVAPRPQGDKPITVAVTNQGLDPTRAVVRLTQCTGTSCPEGQLEGTQDQAAPELCGACTRSHLRTLDLAPGEVAVLEAAFPDKVHAKHEVHLAAAADHAEDRPEATPRDNRLGTTFRLESIERLEVRAPPGKTIGLGVQPAVGETQEPRTVTLRLRNTGNVPISDTITLSVEGIEGRGTAEVQGSLQRAVHLSVGEATQLSWTVTPSGEGILRARATAAAVPFTTYTDPHAFLYADRSPGVACADNLSDLRRCAATWEVAADLPVDGDQVEAVAPSPTGGLFAVIRGAQVLHHDGSSWQEVGRLDGGRPAGLVTLRDTVLAIGRSGQVTELTPTGLRPLPDAPVSSVVEVAARSPDEVVVAGRTAGGIGVAIGDGSAWKLRSSPSEAFPGDERPEIAGLAVTERAIHVAVRQGSSARLCEVGHAFPESSFSCFGPSLDLATPDTLLDIGAVGNLTILFTGPAATGQTVCDQTAATTGPAAYLLRPAAETRRQLCPVTLPSGLAIGEIVPVGGASWILPPEGTGVAPHILTLPGASPLIEPVNLPLEEPLQALGGGAQHAAGAAGETTLVLARPSQDLANEGDWRRGVHLGPVAGDSLLSTDTRDLSRQDPGDSFTTSQPLAERAWLRGTCGERESAFDSPCLDLVDPGTGQVRLGQGGHLESLDIVLRYNLRLLGEGPVEVRALLDPEATPKHVPAGGSTTVDTSADTDPGAATDLLLQDLQETLFNELEDRCSSAVGEVRKVPGEVTDQDVPCESATSARIDGPGSGHASARAPHVLLVGKLSAPTPASWQMLTLSIGDAVEQFVHDWHHAHLVGIEIAMPVNTSMAIDAVWLNGTINSGTSSEDKTFLHTPGTKDPGHPDIKGRWTDTPRTPPPHAQVAKLVGDDLTPAEIKGGILIEGPTAYSGAGPNPRFELDEQVWVQDPNNEREAAWRPSPVTAWPAWLFAPTDLVMGRQEAGEDKSVSMDRLVTPIVDLRAADDPIMSFRHAYAFPLDQTGALTGAGWIEAQVEVAPGQWSHWTRLRPEGGYPTVDRLSKQLQAFTGSIVEVDRNRQYMQLLDPANWEEVRVDLFNQSLPVEGKRARFAFTALSNYGQGEVTNSEKGEGWILSDLKVTAADPPAVDLAIDDVRFEESYPIERTGLAPGSTVNLNVTLENTGLLPTQGGQLTWQLRGLSIREHVLAEAGTPLAELQPGQRTWLNLEVPVPADLSQLGTRDEDPKVYIAVRYRPSGAPDEDPANNQLMLGSPSDPIPVRRFQDLDLQLTVSPEASAPDRIRIISLMLKNTGNVPLEGIEVHRSIGREQGTRGLQDLPQETRRYLTTRTLAAGESAPLSALVEGFPLSELLWTPVLEGSYLVHADARAGPRTAVQDVSVHASAPFLAAGAEDRITGTGLNGTLELGPGWGTTTPGLLGTAKAWKLGPLDHHTVPGNGTITSLLLPSVDLATAKSAQLSITHVYDFEDRFDGGRVEASADGGRTWRPLVPSQASGPAAYGSVLGGNPLAQGNLTVDAFTGTTGGQEVRSTFDLRQIPAFTEPGELANHDLETLVGNSTRQVAAPLADAPRDHVYTHPTWIRGSIGASEAFLVENNTAPMIDRGDPGFLYTGRVGEEPVGEPNAAARLFLKVEEIDDTEEGWEDRRVEATWWEWGWHAGAKDDLWEVAFKNRGTAFWHRNVYEPVQGACNVFENKYAIRVLEVDGPWRKLGVDLTELALAGGGTAELQVAWTPPDTSTKLGTGIDLHRGIALDDLRVRSFNEDVGGSLFVEEERIDLNSAELEKDITGDQVPGDCEGWTFDDAPGDSGVFRHVEDVTHDDEEAWQASWHTVELPHETMGTNTVLSSSARIPAHRGVYNPTPYGDSRLVLPAVDLRGSQDNVSLSFDHLAAFAAEESGRVGGGVVEISVFDPVNGTWGSWQQLYAKPGQLGNWTALQEERAEEGPYTGPDGTGGYGARVHAYTLPNIEPANPDNPTGSLAMNQVPFNAYPFETHAPDPAEISEAGGSVNRHTPFERHVFLYNQCEANKVPAGDCWAHEHRWENASYDLSRFAGKEIRIGFHAYTTSECAYDLAYAPRDGDKPEEKLGDGDLSQPGIQPVTIGKDVDVTFGNSCPTDGERWLLDNVTIQGQALSGKRVHLRFAAGLDGSVHDASWTIDEVEFQGSNYERNLGLFVNQEPLDLAPGASTTVRGVVRNLGTEVRGGIAVRATVEGADPVMELGLPGAVSVTGTEEVTSEPFPLGPGDEAPFALTLKAPGLDLQEGPATLRLEVVQFSQAMGTFGRVTGEEVGTNLERSLRFNVTDGALRIGDLVATPLRVLPGNDTVIELELDNPSPTPVPVELTCELRPIRSWQPADHGRADEVDHEPLLGEPTPCDVVDTAEPTVEGTLIAKLQATLEGQAAYLVHVEVRDRAKGVHLETRETIVWAGDVPRRMIESFEGAGSGSQDQGSTGQGWSLTCQDEEENDDASEACGQDVAFPTREEARRGTFSLLSGITRSAFDAGESYPPSRNASIITRPIDLHNQTHGAPVLSLYHMARLATGDGADVRVRAQLDESAGTWTDWCKLTPRSGYEGFVISYHVPPPPQDSRSPVDAPEGRADRSPDYNPALTRAEIKERFGGTGAEAQEGPYRERGYFGTTQDARLGLTPRWDGDWVLDVFPLDRHPLTREPLTCNGQPLLERVVQFKFGLYSGEGDDAPTGGLEPDPFQRGRGQGWYLDSVVVAGSNTTLEPTTLTAPMLDNATKRFPVHLTNGGVSTEYARLTVDRDRSTTTAQEAQAHGHLSVEPDSTEGGWIDVRFDREPLALPFEHNLVATAEGLLDPNQEASTHLKLNFDPRFWPDLAAEILQPSEPPVEGVPSVIPVQVINHGRATAQPTSLILRATFGNATQEARVELPAIPSSNQDPLAATTTVFVPFTPPRGTAGAHNIEVLVDPEEKLEEYTRHDNRVISTLQVEELRIPDLRFDETNLTLQTHGDALETEERGTVKRFTVDAGTLVTLEVPVLNTGTAPARNVDVRLSMGPVVLPAQRVARLDPGESSRVSFTFVAQEGTHELGLEASAASRDLNPSDNRAPTAGALTLVASSFRVEAQPVETLDVPTPGTEHAIQLQLTNRGALGVLLELSARQTRDLQLDLESRQLFLGAGDSATVQGTLKVAPGADGGLHTLTVVAQAADDPTQGVEVDVPVRLPVVHDLSVQLERTELAPGPGTVPVTLDNAGNLVEDLVLRPYLEGEPVGPATPVTVPRGATRTVELAMTVPATADPGSAELLLTLKGTLTDSRVIPVTLEATDRPVLTTDRGTPTFGPRGISLPLTVTNLGNQPFTGTATVDPGTGLERARVTPAALSLAPGASQALELVIPSEELAAHEGPVSVLLQNEQGEQRAAGQVPLPTERPDATVLKHEMTPAEPAAGEDTRLRVTVGNTGRASARDLPVELFIDGEFAARGTIDEVGPGASRTISFNWPAFAGSHVAAVALDPGGSVADADATNNLLSIPVETTGGQDALTQLTDGLREVPGPGGLSLLIAAGAALAVLGRRRGRG